MGFPSIRTVALAALVAALVPLLEALSHLDPQAITDWRAWAVGLGAGAIRAAASAIISALVLKNDRAVIERAQAGVVPAAETPPGTGPVEVVPVVRIDDSTRGD